MKVTIDSHKLEEVLGKLAEMSNMIESMLAQTMGQPAPVTPPAFVPPASSTPIPLFVPPAPAATPLVAPAPVFAAPPFAVDTVANPIPFSNTTELMDYAMKVYNDAQDKMVAGAAIQSIIKSLGAVQLSDIKPEQYALLYTQLETIK